MICIFMSSPNILVERQEYMEELQKNCYQEAGLVYWGKNRDGEREWIGTQEKWDKAMELWEQAINEEY